MYRACVMWLAARHQHLDEPYVRAFIKRKQLNPAAQPKQLRMPVIAALRLFHQGRECGRKQLAKTLPFPFEPRPVIVDPDVFRILEEVAVPSRQGGSPLAPADLGFEGRDVELDYTRSDANFVGGDVDGVAQGPAKLVQRLAERLTRLFLVAFAPEQRRELVPRCHWRFAAQYAREKDQLFASPAQYGTVRSGKPKLAEGVKTKSQGSSHESTS